MTRAEIITEIHNLPDFNALLKKLFPAQEDLRDDLRQEAILVLCEMPEERLMKLYRDGKLKYYFLGTIRLMAASKYSRFYYQYRKRERLNLGEDALARCSRDMEADTRDLENKRQVERILGQADQALKQIGKVRWYDEELFRLYVRLGCNSTKVARETLIPRPSVVSTVNRVLAVIRKAVDQEKKTDDGTFTIGPGGRRILGLVPGGCVQMALALELVKH